MTEDVRRTRLPVEEPDLGPWRECSLAGLADSVHVVASRRRESSTRRGPLVVAVDGRSGSGKTTLAMALQSCYDVAAVVHTDDIAWHHSFFDWDGLLVSELLDPVSAGRDVSFRPEAWAVNGRDAVIHVPVGLSLLLVEGVGASRRELAPWLDAALWIQSDVVDARTRDRPGHRPRARAARG